MHKWRTMRGAALAVAMMLTAASAQRGPGPGGPNGPQEGRERRGPRPILGLVESVTEETLTLKLFGRPGGGRGGPGGRQGDPPLPGEEGPQTVEVKLSAETRYHDLVAGSEADLADGLPVVIVGTGTEDALTARGIGIYAGEETEDPRQTLGLMMLASMAVRRAARVDRGEDAQMIGGTITSVVPLVIQARTRDGEREVAVTLSEQTAYLRIETIEREGLHQGFLASVMPVPPRGAPRPPQSRPQQGGDGPAEPPTAALILQQPAPQPPR